MKVLALETSTEHGSCALWLDGQCHVFECPAGQPHSQTLLPQVRALLAAAEVPLAAIDAIAFGQGPGAFTGLRVACGLAQGLAAGLDRPVVPVGSLEALVWGAAPGRVMALLDARMEEVYAASYMVGEEVELEGEIQVLAPAEIAVPAGIGVAAGNALRAHPVLAERFAQAGWLLLPERRPTASAIAALAARRFAAGFSVDAASVAPLYVRDKVARTVRERLAQGGKA